MGAEVFHGRVRDGIGCINLAMTTGPPGRILDVGLGLAVLRGARVRLEPRLGAACSADLAISVAGWRDVSSIGRLGPLGCMGYPTSTCGLST